MKNENLYYMNKNTGEVTKNHSEAVQWYNEGDEVAIIDWSECLQEWITRCEWVH